MSVSTQKMLTLVQRIILGVIPFLFFVGCSRPIPFFQPLKPALKRLPNGMELFILEDHELPTAELQLFVRGGSVYDPPGKEGLSSVAMQSIRLGGIEGRKPDEIEEALEFVGASLEMGASGEDQSASLSLLKKDLPAGLEILFGLLQKPALEPRPFKIVKQKAKEALLRKKEDPLSLGYFEFPNLIYGDKSPWGRKPSVQSIDRITWDDVREFHRHFIRPDRIVLAAAGDFTVEEMTNWIDKNTASWRGAGGADLPPIEPVTEQFSNEKVIIPLKGLTQATILMGHLGGKRDNPDKFPLIVMNFILGGSGSLASRLGEEIRSSAGKAYGIWSDYGFGKDFGIFKAIAQTAVGNTVWVLHKMEEMILELSRKPAFRGDEVRRAKEAILRSLFFDFETRFSQVRQLAQYHLWGYPEDYLTIYQKEISRVTERDLERVARRYLHPDGMKILVVTDTEEAKRLSDYTVRGVE